VALAAARGAVLGCGDAAVGDGVVEAGIDAAAVGVGVAAVSGARVWGGVGRWLPETVGSCHQK
jgi:hypothetical protein